MTANPKQALHALIDGLSDEEVRSLSTALTTVPEPDPLTAEDLLLTTPILPDDETADELIATVRRWRREGGDA